MCKEMLMALLLLVSIAPTAFGEGKTRKRIADLITAMEKDGKQVVELVKLTSRDFGMRPELWKKWLDGTSDEQLARIRERVRRTKELDEHWREYARVVAGLYFAEGRKKARDELKAIEKRSKEPQAWTNYSSGLGALVGGGDPARAARYFAKVFKETPLSHYAAEADELAFLLGRMAEENKAWVRPKDTAKLTQREKITFQIHRLRDVQVDQFLQPGTCYVLNQWGTSKENAAIELNKLGKDAIPALLDLLDDRRPIRSVGYWRNFWPERTILRYQDAAIQILDELLPVAFYRGSSTAAYLSNERPQVRYRLIALLRDWHQGCRGKTEAEKLWLAVKLKPGIYPTIGLLKQLAKDHKQDKEVLKELHSMYRTLHRVYRPFIVELMAELGDESKVGEVLAMLDKKEFQKYHAVSFPDDSAAYLNAEDAAMRLLKKYSKKQKVPRSGREASVDHALVREQHPQVRGGVLDRMGLILHSRRFEVVFLLGVSRGRAQVTPTQQITAAYNDGVVAPPANTSPAH
jgi:hypothetical protein